MLRRFRLLTAKLLGVQIGKWCIAAHPNRERQIIYRRLTETGDYEFKPLHDKNRLLSI